MNVHVFTKVVAPGLTSLHVTELAAVLLGQLPQLDEIILYFSAGQF